MNNLKQLLSWQVDEPISTLEFTDDWYAGGLITNLFNEVVGLLKTTLQRFIKSRHLGDLDVSIEFGDSDLSDINHANAYFNYTVRGPREQLDELKSALNEYAESGDTNTSYLPRVYNETFE